MVRDDVLQALEAHRGQLVSGGALARELGVSRTAVWKAITSLREAGFPIESVFGEGYYLSESSDALSEAGIRLGLHTNTLGKELLVFSEIDSTNNYIKQHAASLSDGCTVIADSQTAGRGRLGRSFFSPSGSGVYISILLRPDLPLEQINMITVGAAVAMCEAITQTADFEPDLKWVNDVLKNGKKLCGILTEASVEAETGSLSYAVVGIGINVRCPSGGLPEDIQNIAGFLEDYAPHPVHRNALVAAFLDRMEQCYQLICDGDITSLIERYRSYIHFLGQPITVIRGGQRSSAVAAAIDDRGHLVIEQNGERSTLVAGEISIRLPEQQQ